MACVKPAVQRVILRTWTRVCVCSAMSYVLHALGLSQMTVRAAPLWHRSCMKAHAQRSALLAPITKPPAWSARVNILYTLGHKNVLLSKLIKILFSIIKQDL